jgi:hypothetical protein
VRLLLDFKPDAMLSTAAAMIETAATRVVDASGKF